MINHHWPSTDKVAEHKRLQNSQPSSSGLVIIVEERVARENGLEAVNNYREILSSGDSRGAPHMNSRGWGAQNLHQCNSR